MKPSWDKAPEWANWVARDLNGEWWWYEDKPIARSDAFMASTGRCESANLTTVWDEVLESRPEVSPPSDPDITDGETRYLLTKEQLQTWTFNEIAAEVKPYSAPSVGSVPKEEWSFSDGQMFRVKDGILIGDGKSSFPFGTRFSLLTSRTEGE